MCAPLAGSVFKKHWQSSKAESCKEIERRHQSLHNNSCWTMEDETLTIELALQKLLVWNQTGTFFHSYSGCDFCGFDSKEMSSHVTHTSYWYQKGKQIGCPIHRIGNGKVVTKSAQWHGWIYCPRPQESKSSSVVKNWDKYSYWQGRLHSESTSTLDEHEKNIG